MKPGGSRVHGWVAVMEKRAAWRVPGWHLVMPVGAVSPLPGETSSAAMAWGRAAKTQNYRGAAALGNKNCTVDRVFM